MQRGPNRFARPRPSADAAHSHESTSAHPFRCCAQRVCSAVSSGVNGREARIPIRIGIARHIAHIQNERDSHTSRTAQSDHALHAPFAHKSSPLLTQTNASNAALRLFFVRRNIVEAPSCILLHYRVCKRMQLTPHFWKESLLLRAPIGASLYQLRGTHHSRIAQPSLISEFCPRA